MPGNFIWVCPICNDAVSGRTIPGRGLSRSNHLRSHGIWTSVMNRTEINDNVFLKALYASLVNLPNTDFYEVLRIVRAVRK